MLDPKVVFQTLRKVSLTQDDLKKNIQEFEYEGVKVVINGELKVLDINTEGVEGDVNEKIIKAVNIAIESMQKEHVEALQNLSN